MFAFQQAMRRQQQQQIEEQRSPHSVCTPGFIHSAGPSDSNGPSSNGGSVAAHSPAGSFISSGSSDSGTSASASGRQSGGGNLIFSIENILKFGDFYTPVLGKMGLGGVSLDSVAKYLTTLTEKDRFSPMSNLGLPQILSPGTFNTGGDVRRNELHASFSPVK